MYRMEEGKAAIDGNAYFLTTVDSEIGDVKHSWALGYPTLAEATAAAHALIATGTVRSVYINHEVKVYRRAE
jgi:hypothetical protein